MKIRNLFLGTVLMLALVCACGGDWTPEAGINLYGTVSSEGRPVAGVWVSDGYSMVQTDARGRYGICSSKRQQVVFVIPPSGYLPPCAEGEVGPAFWHPTSVDSASVERHDFCLEKKDEGRYAVLFLPDAHLCNSKGDLALFDSLTVSTCEKIRRDLQDSCQTFITVNLGDVSHDRYWYAARFDVRDAYRHLCQSGIQAPLFSIPGNHDHDPSICCPQTELDDFEAQEKYRMSLGPGWYALNIGKEHWVFMDNMQYVNTPLEKPTVPGVAGKRDYQVCFTEDQLSWLEKDLQVVAPGTTVCLCAHGPLFDNRMLCQPREQVAFLDSLAAAHSLDIVFFAGHAHRMETAFRKEFPHIIVHTLPAVSGNMWESSPQSRPLGLDGCEGGVEYALFTDGGMTRKYVTYNGANPYFRAYDFNVLRRQWSGSPDYTWIRNEVKRYVDYTKAEYKNGILVNFWWQSPGESIEVLEDGRPLSVVPAPFAVDPDGLYSHFTYRRKKYEGCHLNPEDIELALSQLYYARAHSDRSEIVVRVREADGQILFEEKLQRK